MAKRGRPRKSTDAQIKEWANQKPQTNTGKRKYSRHTNKGRKLIGPNGRLYANNIKRIIYDMQADLASKKISKTEYKYKMRILVNAIESKRNANVTLTDNGFYSMTLGNKADKYLANMGKSKYTMAAELGITVAEVEGCNWTKEGNATIVELPDGRRYQAVFTYDDKTFFEVN